MVTTYGGARIEVPLDHPPFSGTLAVGPEARMKVEANEGYMLSPDYYFQQTGGNGKAERIEQGTNELLARATATETVWITDEELDARPELVKTMSVQPPRGAGRVRLLKIPGIDLQPCGGTHVANIGEIGAIRVVRIRNEGKKNKRVEIALG